MTRADSRRGFDTGTIQRRQDAVRTAEFRAAIRALLITPLMHSGHDEFAAVRRHADELTEWFLRETGWLLEVERGGARLYKRPADLSSHVRGLDGYDRRRYVLLCLACAVLERAEPQITLRVLGEQLLALAADPALATAGFTFTLMSQTERRELVAACRTLLELGVLGLVAGEDEAYAQAGGEHGDALYDVHRRQLAGMFAAARGPSSWPADTALASLDDRLRSLVEEPVADSDEGRRIAMRHALARRLLDDPVVYTDTMDPDTRAYFVNQRGAMGARLADAAGLVAEQRAEGLALVDEAGSLTDIAMPAEGTDADRVPATVSMMRVEDIVAFVRDAKAEHGRYWRKTARLAGAERELAAMAIGRLEKLHLVVRVEDDAGAAWVAPRPALARFALAAPEIAAPPARQRGLFDELSAETP
jgi:uncharacterized protein (TIGR02678 family)